jgi:hypothetical protein
MPRVIDRATDCAVYLYESVADANNGKRTGGSGFLFGVPMEIRGDFIYAVSNWHVVKHAPVVRLNTADGKTDVMPLTVANWYPHPDKETDLAVTPINLDLSSKYQAMTVGYDQLLTREWVREFNVGIGDDLFLVGRFIDHDGVQRNQPTVRFGAIAQMPGNPIQTEVGSQDAFLAEIRSISGFSGSPVFALIPRHRDTSLPVWERMATPLGGIGGKERILLIGIDCGHMSYLDQNISEEVRNRKGDIQLRETNLWTNVNTGMAIVIAAWKLDELLGSGELKAMRDDENERRRKAASHTRLDYAAPRPQQTQKTLAPKEEDRIDIPIPTKGEVMDVFKKATQKRGKK